MQIARSVHPLPGEAERKERLLGLVDGFSSRRVLVLGDLIADEFIYGEVSRVSREAPVLILKYDATQIVAGGAGNAANNVAALGGRARLSGLVGTDGEGRRLLASFHRGVDKAHVVRARGYRTPVKTRILAGGVHAARQQVVRIDRDTGWPLDEAVSAALAKKIEPALDGCDAVILSDYGSGLVTPALADAIRRAVARRTRRRPIPVLVDSRYRLLDYRGLTTCTPNESEVEAALGIQIDDDPEALERAGRLLLRRTGTQAVLDHARQPRHGAVSAEAGDHPRADFRRRRGRRRHRRRRHGDRGVRPRARRGRVVLRSGAARQLCRRARRHEARHGDGVGAGAVRRGDQRSRHDARALVAGRAAAGTAVACLTMRRA